MVDGEKTVGVLERMMKMVRKYKLIEWLELIFVIFMIGAMVSIFAHPKEVIDYFEKAREEQHSELLDRRQANNPKLQEIADRLLYNTGADRVEILECHNQLHNLSGNPFIKASASVESISEGTLPIADQYDEVQLSLVPFSSYLYNVNYWSGTPEEMKDMDRALSYRLLSNDVNYLLAGTIPGKDRPIGFLFVTYCQEKLPADYDKLVAESQRAAVAAGLLLELEK